MRHVTMVVTNGTLLVRDCHQAQVRIIYYAIKCFHLVKQLKYCKLLYLKQNERFDLKLYQLDVIPGHHKLYQLDVIPVHHKLYQLDVIPVHHKLYQLDVIPVHHKLYQLDVIPVHQSCTN